MRRSPLVTVDGQEILNFGRQSIPTIVPGHRINSAPFGTMGFGMPFAVGRLYCALGTCRTLPFKPDPRLGAPGERDARIGIDACQRRTIDRDEDIVIWPILHREGSGTIWIESVGYGDRRRHMLINTIDGECHKVGPGAVSVNNMKSSAIAYRLLRDPKCGRKQRSQSAKRYCPLSVARVHFSALSPAYPCSTPMLTTTPRAIAHNPARFTVSFPSTKSIGSPRAAEHPIEACSSKARYKPGIKSYKLR